MEGVDDARRCATSLLPRAFTTRFAARFGHPAVVAAHRDAAPAGRRGAYSWRYADGRVRTDLLGAALGVTREHLSRSVRAAGAPNLKRVIDLVRLIAAAELSKNPGYDVGDVAGCSVSRRRRT